MRQNYLSRDLMSLVEAELAPRERIIWTGQPIAGRLMWQSLGIVLFGIAWTAFALFWIAGAAQFKMPDFSSPAVLFPLFGVPFVLIGLAMISSPFRIRGRAQKTVYAITDQRAIIVFKGWRAISVRSFAPDQLRDLRRTQRRDDSGDLIFERALVSTPQGHRNTIEDGFRAVRDVREVEGLIRQHLAP